MMRTLLRHYGSQNWWPARSRFEVIAGAVLVQNTAWGNAEKALRNLRQAGKLHPEGIRRTGIRELEKLVRPSGFFRQKAGRLKGFVRFLERHHAGSLRRMFATPTPELREQLLALNGIGPETADAILLYGGGHEVFVGDAYAQRVLERHGLRAKSYEEANRMYVDALAGLEDLPRKSTDPRHAPSRVSRRRKTELAQLYDDAHAVIVRVGSEFCRRAPACLECPLREWLPSHPGAQSRH